MSSWKSRADRSWTLSPGAGDGVKHFRSLILSTHKGALQPVHQHGACKSKEGAWGFPFEGLPELWAFGLDHSFADTIEALLRASTAGSIDPETGMLSIPGLQQVGMLRIEIDIREPYAMSVVWVGLQGRGENGTLLTIHPVSRNYEVQ